VVTKLVQNTSIHNKREKIHNYLKNVTSKKRWHPPTNFDSILLVITKDNVNLELQGLLEQNDFTNKLVTKITHAMSIYMQLTYLNKKE
jgi:hypothetical protein